MLPDKHDMERIWTVIQYAANEALRAQQFGLAAVKVTDALEAEGYTIVSSRKEATT